MSFDTETQPARQVQGAGHYKKDLLTLVHAITVGGSKRVLDLLINVCRRVSGLDASQSESLASDLLLESQELIQQGQSPLATATAVLDDLYGTTEAETLPDTFEGEVLEVTPDTVTCWVNIADDLRVKTAVPRHLFDSLNLYTGLRITVFGGHPHAYVPPPAHALFSQDRFSDEEVAARFDKAVKEYDQLGLDKLPHRMAPDDAG
jgi:hypothetical protein